MKDDLRYVLSIKPEYADAILNRKKTMEIRKRFGLSGWRINCETVYLYATSPVRKIIGRCTIDEQETIAVNPSDMDESEYMKMILDRLCISRADLTKYLGSKTGFVYEVSEPVRFSKQYELSDFSIDSPPQNYCTVYLHMIPEEVRE